MKKIIAVIVLALALTGCGGSPDRDSNGSAPSFLEFSTVVIQHEGKPLTCVIQGNIKGGPSCDWVKYHHENGFSND